MCRRQLYALVFAAAFSVTAQADVVQVSEDTYMAYRSSKAGMFANMSKLKAAVIREANEFAASRGKVAVPVSSAEEHRPHTGFPSVEYQFRIVDRDTADAKNRAIPAQADQVIENRGHTSSEIQTSTDQKPDLYTELLKLDDLRKRGLLTDEEFEARKKRLLEQ